MTVRRRRDRCASCQRSDFIDARDNLGNWYKGCAHCVVADIATATAPTPTRAK